jgi:hypothetical protein
VVKLSLGLDFVKEVDKNWKNRIKSLDRTNDEDVTIDKIEKPKKEKQFETKLNNDKPDYWDYWKKRYWLRR